MIYRAPEGEGLPDVTGADAEPTKMSEVLRLTSALAEQMLGSQVMGRALPPNQLTALVRAARFLTDNNVTWPPSVQEVVRVASEKVQAARKI